MSAALVASCGETGFGAWESWFPRGFDNLPAPGEMDVPQDVAQVFISSVCDDRFVFECFGKFSFGVKDTPMVVDNPPDGRLPGVVRG